jgi:TatD DNase family protein
MFVDSHCHLELEQYDEDLDRIIGLAGEKGVSYMVTVGTEERYFEKVLRIIDSYPTVYGAIGIHPHNAESYSDWIETLIKGILRHPKIVAYGEIGLDYYRDYSPREAQIRAFEGQIEIARADALPIIVHSRSAKEETIGILKGAGLEAHKAVIHCYSYDLDAARRLLDLGMYLSIPGTVTYKNSGLTEIVRYVPLDRLLSETDAPFLTPHPYRGKRNQPAYVALVAQEIARIKEMGVEETAQVLGENFNRIFLAPREKEVQ